MEVFFSVGEPSGDLHGSNLVRELQRRNSAVHCVGYGGPKMQAAGVQLHADLTELAGMGIGPVLGKIPQFLDYLIRADRYFCHQRPDAVVLIDYPGFNWWIARRAKAHGIPVFYYGVPQLWAWGRWRVRKMRRLIDHVLCKLPFEEGWFRQRGCQATFLGHPYFDQLVNQKLDTQFLETFGGSSEPLVTILPGSRRHEIASNLNAFLKAADYVHQAVPGVRFAIASYNDQQAHLARQICASRQVDIEVITGRTQELIHLAHCCMACSGSVSLELLYHRTPSVIHYHIQRLSYQLLRPLLKVKYITLLNILADADPFPKRRLLYDPQNGTADGVLMPEYLTYEDKSQQVANHVIEWLTSETAYSQVVERLDALRSSVCTPGASQRCAEYVLHHLEQRVPKTPRPHYQPKVVASSSRKQAA